VAEIARRISKTDRAAYMALPAGLREEVLASYKGLDSEGQFPKRGTVALDLVKYAMLYQLVTASLAAEHRQKASDISKAICCVMTARPVRLGPMVGFARIAQDAVIFDPNNATLQLVGDESNDAADDDGDDD